MPQSINDLDEVIARILNGELDLYGRIVDVYQSQVRSILAAMVPAMSPSKRRALM